MSVAKAISSSVMPERTTGTFVDADHMRSENGSDRISNSKSIEINTNISNKWVVQDSQGEKDTRQTEEEEENKIEKEKPRRSVSISRDSVCTHTQKPEDVTNGQRLNNANPSQGDLQQVKSRRFTVFYKICHCFCFAGHQGDPLHESTETRKVSTESGRNKLKSQSRSSKNERYSSSNKAIRSLLIVVVAFFIWMTPFCITKLYKVIVSNQDALPGSINVIATIFQFCSSAINPMIYCIFRKDFRHVFRFWLRRVTFRSTSRNNISVESDTFSY